MKLCMRIETLSGGNPGLQACTEVACNVHVHTIALAQQSICQVSCCVNEGGQCLPPASVSSASVLILRFSQLLRACRRMSARPASCNVPKHVTQSITAWHCSMRVRLIRNINGKFFFFRGRLFTGQIVHRESCQAQANLH